jgi:hypothetical protein
LEVYLNIAIFIDVESEGVQMICWFLVTYDDGVLHIGLLSILVS